MKITIKNTSKIVEFNGIPARIWEGETESGIKIHCFITRIMVNKDEPRIKEFHDELQIQNTPRSEIQAIPMKLII